MMVLVEIPLLQNFSYKKKNLRMPAVLVGVREENSD